MKPNHLLTIEKGCSAQCAYKFTLGTGLAVGHLLSMSFTNSGKDFVVDRKLCNPEAPDDLVPTMGVFDEIQWLGSVNPIRANIRTSEENSSLLQEALSSLTGGAEVEMNWAIYVYSHKAKKYFKHFSSDEKKIKFTITPGFQIAPPTLNKDIAHPLNYSFPISLTPKSEGEEQEVQIAYSIDSPFTRRIGAAAA